MVLPCDEKSIPECWIAERENQGVIEANEYAYKPHQILFTVSSLNFGLAELNAEIATVILGTTGLAIEHVADGTEAVDRMASCKDGYYDIIFMDIQMPRMNGYDATRAIRSMDRNYCRQVPIVAMTANAFAEDVQADKTVGMNEHIAKPLDLKSLARTLDRWLN